MERAIGIKVADGTFFPVLEEGFFGDKRLVLTTVRDGQAEVHVDLYQGAADVGIAGSRYIGSLIIENISPGPKGGPDIEVVMGATREGNLNVSATDRTTGEEQSLSVSLRGSDEESEFDVPDFDLQAEGEAAPAAEEPESPEEEPAVVYRSAVSAQARPSASPARRRSVAIVLAALFALVAICGLGYVIYRVIANAGGRAEATKAAVAQPAKAAEPVKAAEPAKAAEPVKAAEPAKAAEPVKATEPAKAAEPAKAVESAKAAEPAAAATGSLPGAEPGVRYRIKWGDTLWDLSSSYYRDPWLYPRIAKANSIKNPDLIFAGTTIFVPER